MTAACRYRFSDSDRLFLGYKAMEVTAAGESEYKCFAYSAAAGHCLPVWSIV